MQKWSRFVVALAVGAACFYGPFTHIHAPGDAEAHVASEHVSAGIAFHIHLAGRTVADSSWRAAEESARPLEWFRFEKAQDPVAAPPPESAALPPPASPGRGLAFILDSPAPELRNSSPPVLRGPPALS